MRFIANGPDVPGDLLDARDEGQVIFFCGAGVSRAEAGGPSFRELADAVVKSLGSSRTSAARQLLEISETIVPVPGVGGIPPADRIFAMLEQEFPVPDVRRAVAKALRPKDNAGLGPHRSLVDLSRGPDGVVRLVTTNFDRVFELADPTLIPIDPPVLPDPAHATTFRGIVHLHGKVSIDYLEPASPEFVLSSADFGRAYLADGWATSFMRALMERYRIVFVGYSADDPPIQYLLEALQPSLAPGRLYAFQEGEASIATGLWRHKGVTAIPFKGFDTLWTTLEAWAERARDHHLWREEVATMATRGPRDLTPHERGQVAHLVSSQVGARIFARQEPAPPAEWLCAFDPYVRYGDPRPRHRLDADREGFDPFEHYGLDDDVAPDRSRGHQPLTATMPADSWSAFKAAPGEQFGLNGSLLPSLRGPSARQPASLPRRLSHLAGWLERVAGEPCALWWASAQNGLHPDLTTPLRRALMSEGIEPQIRHAWLLLLAALDESPIDPMERYQLQSEIEAGGWSRLAMIRLAEIERPRLTVSRPPLSPIADVEIARHLISADVTYSSCDPDLTVPDEFLLDHIEATRRNLVIATRLEEEIGGFGLERLRPINPYNHGEDDFDAREAKLETLIVQLIGLIRRQHQLAPDLARAEVANWRSEMGLPFRNLRVWAMGEPTLTDGVQASSIARNLGEAFWDDDLERDLLISLKARWQELDGESRSWIEAATLAGPAPWEGIDPADFEPYRVDAILRRLFWLQRESMTASFDIAARIADLKEQLPEWQENQAADRLDHSRSRGGLVKTDSTHDMLLDVPLDALLEEASKASGHGPDFLTHLRPFIGFIQARPVRALSALRRAAARGESSTWAWNDLLGSQDRERDRPRYRGQIVRCIAAMPDDVLLANLRAVSYWLKHHAQPVWRDDRALYRRIWEVLRTMIERHPAAALSTVTGNRRPDWVHLGLSSPVGNLTELLFQECDWSQDSACWDSDIKDRATQLISLPEGPKALAVARLAMRTNWLYNRDPGWTEEHLIPLLEGKAGQAMAEAATSGLLWQDRRPPDGLYRLLKPMLVERFVQDELVTEREDALARILLVGWYARNEAGERLITSDELREALIHTREKQRVTVLGLVGRWAGESDQNAAQTETFLHEVWPRQLSARSAKVSAALAHLALRAGERMPEITAAVLPILETSAEPIEMLPLNRRAVDDQLTQFPEEHLALLYTVLPRDAQLWSWGMAHTIERLGEIDTLKGDPRLIDLRRRQTMF